MKIRLHQFFGALPCPDCRGEAALYIRAYPPVLDSSEELQRWCFAFHNAVNARLGKPEMSVDAYLDAWGPELTRAYGRHLDIT